MLWSMFCDGLILRALWEHRERTSTKGREESWQCISCLLICNKPSQHLVAENNNHLLPLMVSMRQEFRSISGDSGLWERRVSHETAVRCWLELQSSEGLRLGDLLPRWPTHVAAKLVPLRGLHGCSHDMAADIPQSKCCKRPGWKLPAVHGLSLEVTHSHRCVFWSQRWAVAQHGGADTRKWIIPRRRCVRAIFEAAYHRRLSWALKYEQESIWQISRSPSETKEGRHWAADNK